MAFTTNCQLIRCCEWSRLANIFYYYIFALTKQLSPNSSRSWQPFGKITYKGTLINYSYATRSQQSEKNIIAANTPMFFIALFRILGLTNTVPLKSQSRKSYDCHTSLKKKEQKKYGLCLMFNSGLQVLDVSNNFLQTEN